MSPRVLVIEDNAASLELMVYLLKAFGHEALSARDGLEGIATAQRERPDLILCDIQLPGVDGIEVCRQLKSDKATRDINIVAVTAYAMVGDGEKLISQGFNGYLTKPIEPQTFISTIEPYCAVVPRAPYAPAVDNSMGATLDQVSGTILVVDNSAVNIALSRSMLQPFGYRILEARTVDEALNLLRQAIPDLILSDIHMPAKDGFDLIEALKADDGLRAIPFLFISSTLWGERDRQRGLSLGADRVLTRPIEPQALIGEIETVRRNRKGA